MIHIYEPYLPKHILKYAHNALDSKWVSSHGAYIQKTEELLQETNQSKFVILTNNGTSATHLVSIGLKYKYPNLKSLIVPNSVYVAAWNSFRMSENFDFKLCSVNPDTWNGEYERAIRESAPQPCHDSEIGVLVVHNIGNIVNVPSLKSRIDNDSVIFVEDNCEGFLGSYDGSPSGSASLFSSVSFFGNKTLTSGEGGALFTDDEDSYHYLNSVRNQGHSSQNYVFSKLGYNYRMTNIQAALLYGQLLNINEILEKKQEIFNLYKDELQSIDEICFQQIEKNTTHSNWMFAIKGKSKISDLQLHLYQNQIDSRIMFPPINYHNHYKSFEPDEAAADLYEKVIMLPSFPSLTRGQVCFICDQIKSFYFNQKKS